MSRFCALLLSLSVFACAEDSSQLECPEIAASVENCTGAPAEEILTQCEQDPEGALALADAACAGKSDFFGKGAGESCFNFNFECSEGLSCQPVDADENEQRCATPRLAGEFCDDDADCGPGLACAGEGFGTAGTCSSLGGDVIECEHSNDCEAGEVCRPVSAGAIEELYCLPPGSFGDTCIEQAGCESGLSCRNNGLDGGICSRL